MDARCYDKSKRGVCSVLTLHPTRGKSGPEHAKTAKKREGAFLSQPSGPAPALRNKAEQHVGSFHK